MGRSSRGVSNGINEKKWMERVIGGHTGMRWTGGVVWVLWVCGQGGVEWVMNKKRMGL